jgi:photosystem II stability/assembly factor-like uncharacterized protein
LSEALQSSVQPRLDGFLRAPNSWILLARSAPVRPFLLLGGTTWTPSPLPITTNLWRINTSGANGANMLAVGEGGMVLKSTDNGGTCCQLDPGTSVNLYGVDMVTNSEYIVAGENGVLRRTTDGGRSGDDAACCTTASGSSLVG